MDKPVMVEETVVEALVLLEIQDLVTLVDQAEQELLLVYQVVQQQRPQVEQVAAIILLAELMHLQIQEMVEMELEVQVVVELEVQE